MESPWKTLVWSFILGVGIEYAVCLAFSKLIGDENIYYQAFLYMAIVWAVQVALWVKNSIVSTIFYWLWAKNKASSMMSDQISRLGFPHFTKDDWIEDWLGAAMYDDNLSKDAQLFAALLLGQIEFVRGQGIQSQLKLKGIIKLAAMKHTARLPYQKSE